MRESLKTAVSGVASALILTLLLFAWAASPIRGAAHFRAEGGLGGVRAELLAASSPAQDRTTTRGTALPSPVRFRESGNRGLLVRAWVNGAGPFTFAVDTGAGATVLSPHVAGEARVEVESGRRAVEVGGLSGMSVGGQRAFPRDISLGSRDNTLQARGLAVVAPGLPSDIDGILDPSEIFYPLGFIIDLPNGEISFFDPHSQPLRAADAPPGGAVVPWLTDGRSRRPFVMLAEGQPWMPATT